MGNIRQQVNSQISKQEKWAFICLMMAPACTMGGGPSEKQGDALSNVLLGNLGSGNHVNVNLTCTTYINIPILANQEQPFLMLIIEKLLRNNLHNMTKKRCWLGVGMCWKNKSDSWGPTFQLTRHEGAAAIKSWYQIPAHLGEIRIYSTLRWWL